MKPEIYILKNSVLEVHISNVGATIVSMQTTNRNNQIIDTVLGLQKADDYISAAYMETGAYLGATVGRYANRIANGQFTLEDKKYQLAINNGDNHLHGGINGFDKKIWTVISKQSDSLLLRYQSPDGEENYPGELTTDIHFSIEGKELKIEYHATTTEKCYVNLTHHPYFNLNPTGADIKDHQLKLYSNQYLHTDELIPTEGMMTAIGERDFSQLRALKEVIEKHGGLDDCFVFKNTKQIIRQAELFCPESGIQLYICSDYPGLQVYTGRYLNVKNAKQGKHYGAYAGVALEAQYWPDSPNHPSFPSTLLSPGEEYRKTTIYGFE